MVVRTRIPSFPTVLAALALAACGGDAHGGAEATSAEPARSDSAGVPVVVNPAEPPGGAVWAISGAPLLEIGTADGAPEDILYQAFGGMRLADGTLVLANGGTKEVRFYDASGRFLRAVGREGDGPGEFRNLRVAGPIRGDSVVAFDLSLRRFTVIGPDGGVGRVTPTPDEVGGPPTLAGVLEDGSLVLSAPDRPAPTTGVQREPRHVGILSADGARWTSLGDHPGREVSAVAERGMASYAVPFGRDVQVTGAGDRVIVGTSDAFSLRAHDADGALLHLVRQDRPLTPVGPDDFDVLTGPARERARTRGDDRMLAAIEQAPRHVTLPAFSSLMLDRTGHLWVQDSRAVGDLTNDWQVFAPDGALVATVVLPYRLQILEAGAGYLLARETDDLGVERVRLYPFSRGG